MSFNNLKDNFTIAAVDNYLWSSSQAGRNLCVFEFRWGFINGHANLWNNNAAFVICSYLYSWLCILLEIIWIYMKRWNNISQKSCQTHLVSRASLARGDSWIFAKKRQETDRRAWRNDQARCRSQQLTVPWMRRGSYHRSTFERLIVTDWWVKNACFFCLAFPTFGGQNGHVLVQLVDGTVEACWTIFLPLWSRSADLTWNWSFLSSISEET